MVLVPKPRLQIDNVVDNEVVHQRCLLVKGTTWGGPSAANGNSSAETVLLVKSRDAFAQSASQENWPVMNDAFRCLVMLQPGPNELELEIHHGAELYSSVRFTVQYQPLLQLPPLHLVIIVAKDSAYPPPQGDADPSSCSELDTAIAKFRTTAYMWQAYIAETMRLGDLGRRSFRLDEPWQANAATARMDGLARVHVVRSERTVAELRDVDYRPGELSSSDRDALLQPFEQELAAYGAPFIGAARPVVAAMVLDTDWTYAADQEGTLADVPLAWRRSNGPDISFCLFSSRLACAWPRSTQEASACLLDAQPMGPAAPVADYRDQTREEACSDGQTTVLFRLTTTWGCVNSLHVSAADNWKHTFVPTAEPRDTQWRLPEGLRLRARDHFQLPGDRPAGDSQHNGKIEADDDEESDIEYDEDFYGDSMDEWEMTTHCLIDDRDHKTLVITHPRGLAQVRLIRGGNTIRERNYQAQAAPPAVVRIDQDDLADALQEGASLVSRLRITGMDGNWREDDVPDLFGSFRAPRTHRSTIPVPGTSLVLTRHTVRIPELDNKTNDDDDDEEGDVAWAALLQRWHKQGDGRLAYAKCIRVAISNMELSGGSIAYSDGTERRMGQPDDDDGRDETRARVLRRRRDVFAVRQVGLQVGRAPYTQGQLVGCQMVLDDDDDDDDEAGGTVAAWGDLVDDCAQYPVLVLRPEADERVIGFCGRADRRERLASEFGILCAPRAVVDGPDGLPRELYDMPEFMGLEDWDYDSSEDGEDGDEDMNED